MEVDEDRDVLGRFTRDLSFYSVASVVPAVFGVASLVVFTRVFSPAAFGRYALTVAFAAVLSTVLFGWVQQSVLRFRTEVGIAELSSTLLSVLALLLVIGLVLGIAGYLAFFRGSDRAALFYAAGIALTLTRGPFRIAQAFFQANLESRRAMEYKLFHAAIKFALAILLAIVVLDSILGWLVAAALGTGITATIMVYRGFLARSKPGLDRALCRRMLRFGGPMLIWMLGLTLLNFVDRGLIEWLRGSTAVGIYSSNYSIVARGLPLILAPMIQTIHPLVMDAWDGDNPGEIESLISRFTRYFLIIGVPATVLAGIASRPLSTIFLGSQYHAGALVIPVVALGLFLWNLSMIGHKGLEVAERTKVMSVGITVAVVVNVLLNVPLITVMGYYGAAVATAISFGLYAVFVYLVSRKYIRWRVPWRTVRNSLVGGGVLAALGTAPYLVVTYSLSKTLAAGAAGAILYVGVLYGLGEFDETELYAARSALRRTKRWLG